MTTGELITYKLNELLGAKYKLFTNGVFQSEFTSTKKDPYNGSLYSDIEYQAFDKYKNSIIGVVTSTQTSLVASLYRADNVTYTVLFWVPLDFLKHDKDGRLLEKPKFDFYGDMTALKTALLGQEINIYSGLRAFFTMSEPSLVGNIDKTGAFKRAPMQITGQAAIYDTKLKTGKDYRVSVMIDGTEYFFENITDFSLAKPTDANNIPKSNSILSTQEPANTNNACSFSIDDYDAENRPAVKLIHDVCRGLKTELSPTETTPEKKLKIKVRYYTGATKTAEFYGIMSAEQSYAGMAGLSRFNVSIENSGE